ncbi:hypothetical protein Droror1_Dr00027820 [Drosera rotundifolia]
MVLIDIHHVHSTIIVSNTALLSLSQHGHQLRKSKQRPSQHPGTTFGILGQQSTAITKVPLFLCFPAVYVYSPALHHMFSYTATATKCHNHKEQYKTQLLHIIARHRYHVITCFSMYYLSTLHIIVQLCPDPNKCPRVCNLIIECS